MTIEVTQLPSEHHVELFWWKHNQLMGIAEWDEEIDLDYEAEQANDNYEANYD